MNRGFSTFSQSFFVLDANNKRTRGHSCRLVKTRCNRDITKLIKLYTDGICRTSGLWTHLASTYSSLD